MPDYNDRLRDYVQVNERIIAFYKRFPEGSLQSDMITLTDNLVVFRASAYRTADDPRPGVGHSSLSIPGQTPYTRGSEIENAETSAWGRALAALGFEVKRGIASRDEIDNKNNAGGILMGGQNVVIGRDDPRHPMHNIPEEDYSRNPWVEDGKPKLATLAQRGALTKLAKKVRSPDNQDLGIEHLKTRMGDLGVTRETITPEQVQTITRELVEIDAALKQPNDPITEEADIEY